MIDLGAIAMHGAPGALHEPAEDFAHHLMAEADAEDGKLAREFAHDFHRLSRLVRGAGTGRNDDGLCLQIAARDGIVAHDAGGLSKLFEVARDVVHEAVVVIDDEDHGVLPEMAGDLPQPRGGSQMNVTG